jgi:hypothetical protein
MRASGGRVELGASIVADRESWILEPTTSNASGSFHSLHGNIRVSPQ